MILRAFSIFGQISLVALLLASCGQPQVESETAALIEDFVHYDELELELDSEAEVSGTLELLAKRINDDAPVSFSQVTDLWARDHHAAYDPEASEEDYEDFARKIRSLTEGLPADDPHKMKVKLDRRIEKSNSEKIRYNVAAQNMASTIQDSELQCYSGSSTLALAARVAMTPKNFRAQNYVMIFEPGHILFGYMRKTKAGDWRLTGVESTLEGKARVDYGLVSNLPDFVKDQGETYGLRIMDAEYFGILEVFQPVLKDPEKTTQQMLALTAKRYGIDLKLLESSVQRLKNQSKGRASELKSPQVSATELLRGSSAGFGTAPVAEKPLPRKKSKKREASKHRARNALSPEEIQSLQSPGSTELDFESKSVK